MGYYIFFWEEHNMGYILLGRTQYGVYSFGKYTIWGVLFREERNIGYIHLGTTQYEIFIYEEHKGILIWEEHNMRYFMKNTRINL